MSKNKRVAYVRLASVYRRFEEPEDFRRILKGIKMNNHTSAKPLFEVLTGLIKKIDEYEKRISKIEEDICGVRRIIGVSKEFQDWRVLA